MKCVMLIAVLLFGAATTTAQTSEPATHEASQIEMNQAQVELIRSVLHVERKAIIEKNIGLSQSEEQDFWPLYHRYRVETNRVQDRLLKVISEYSKLYRNPAMTDKEALKLLDDLLSFQEEMIRIKHAFLKKFTRVIPAKKVARFYQIDNRLDTMVRLKFSQNIPLFE